ncbi:hypothetical protein PYCCODRAFT_1431376 [Trametes coccinea BRFM310]|uniref:Uncharacterized protein n=1 Tax=Trametes coccinea (strain BRFM310) TaxID=1353009 RepID=A0A1Y2J1R3_TRAC3|nr:hypothetical protein PYCCODRAFT_1431376 [Trametes coccinea BRFM310]
MDTDRPQDTAGPEREPLSPQTLTSVPRYHSPGPPVPFAKGPEGRRDAFPRRREPAAVPRKNCVGPVTPPVPTARVDEGLRGGDVPIA